VWVPRDREEPMDELLREIKPFGIIGTLIYSALGLGIFAFALYIMDKITPFSLRKEIEEDQNTALAIIMGSVFIALAIIIQAALR
jgi:uncharacterized membrane protein YjfL (UPF0719 family)